jgi:hypothetical protein
MAGIDWRENASTAGEGGARRSPRVQTADCPARIIVGLQHAGQGGWIHRGGGGTSAGFPGPANMGSAAGSFKRQFTSRVEGRVQPGDAAFCRA